MGFIKKVIESGIFLFPKQSLKRKLLFYFILLSIIPLLFSAMFSYYNTTKTINNNLESFSKGNLIQAKKMLTIELESYEELLFRLYTNDDLISITENINDSVEVALNRNKLSRILLGNLGTQERIAAITVFTENGSIISFDALTGSVSTSSWYHSLSEGEKEELIQTMDNNSTKLLPTRSIGKYSGESKYLFHIAHRIVNYKYLDKKIGYIVISLNENLLKDLLNDKDTIDTNTSLIIDSDGILVSAYSNEGLGQKIKTPDSGKIKESEELDDFIRKTYLKDSQKYYLDSITMPEYGWEIVSVTNQHQVQSELKRQRNISFVFILISLFVLAISIVALSNKLLSSISNIISTIKQVQGGDLSARVDQIDELQEVSIISTEFNTLMDRLDESINQITEAAVRQKDAEVTALELQINPHFLYNTLDSINWMAIEDENYEMSEMITSLAEILRYGLDNIKTEVTMAEETQWMESYLLLQKLRYKSTFDYEIIVAEQTKHKKIHRLLFQPFIENSIVHGGKDIERRLNLVITTSSTQECLEVKIEDNGKGISEEHLANLISSIKLGVPDQHIGISNSINRMNIYYGPENFEVDFTSTLGIGTTVTIRVKNLAGEDDK